MRFPLLTEIVVGALVFIFVAGIQRFPLDTEIVEELFILMFPFKIRFPVTFIEQLRLLTI